VSATIVVLLAVLWLIALWGATLVSSRTGIVAASASAAVYVAGSLICHQRPERSFHYNGAQLPVCARCLGLYVGGGLGAAAWACVSLSRRLRAAVMDRVTSALAAMPTLMSVGLGFIGLWDGTNAIRAILALPLGAAVGATVTAVAAGDLR
jgi:uncharacterized membrane protein